MFCGAERPREVCASKNTVGATSYSEGRQPWYSPEARCKALKVRQIARAHTQNRRTLPQPGCQNRISPTYSLENL